MGLDAIITDHHEVGEGLPKAIAVIDAKRNDSNYPFRGLAGVGVTFKLIEAISKKLELPAESYLKYLDLVCVGTISDIVPLEDENRVISKLGLKLIKQTKNVGLKTLLKSINYKSIDSNAVSFGLAPRINACGRLGHEEIAVNLFLTESEEEAQKLTDELNKFNQNRQDVERRIFNEALEMIPMDNSSCIVVGKENWHHGVIGIVASKVTELYNKPSILLCYENGIAKGSGRSIKGFDLHEALENCNTYIEQFGGHSMAIGIIIKQDNVEKFAEELNKYTETKKLKDIIPIIIIDAKLELKDITVEDVKNIKILEPFGEANELPIFQFNNLKIESIRALSEGKHLKLRLRDENNKIIDVIGFGMGNLAENYKIGTKVDVVGNLELNEYQGMEMLQLNLKDIRHAI